MEGGLFAPERRGVKLSEVVFDQAIYPRKTHSPALVQRYAECIDSIEARGNFISVAADMSILDGRHRHLAYLSLTPEGDRDIQVLVYPVEDTAEKLALSLELNSEHGAQVSEEEKRSVSIRLYAEYHWPAEAIAARARVRKVKVLEWTKAIRQEEERRHNETIFEMYLACHTQQEIAAATGLSQPSVKEKIEVLSESFPGTNLIKLSRFEVSTDRRGDPEPDEHGWRPPLYNIWTFARKTNEVEHFGNSEQRILENLLYLYTEPFDIVVDPFAGGGATIDICKRRLRRYWVSDRKPSIIRAGAIRELDVADRLPPLDKRWSDVSLTYLDPPYWKQAEGKYSQDAEDLANMPLDQFTTTLAGIVKRIGARQSKGAIALLIQPTQWHAPERQVVDHVLDLVNAVGNRRLKLAYRISCPYSTEQCLPQMVNWAREKRELLVLTRELIVWKVQP